MKKDLDELMAQDHVDAIWVTGALFHNPDMVYFTGVRHVTRADLFKPRGQAPVLYYDSDMEREEAARSGLETRSYEQTRPLDVLREESGGDLAAALAARVSGTLKGLGLANRRIALSGRVAFDSTLALLEKVRELLPEAQFVTYYREGLIQQARMTKDQDEVRRIREIGRVTTRVVARLADYLVSRPLQEETLLKENGEVLRVGDVKAKIRLWLAEEGADNPEETIFSIGRDAGVPHNAGNPNDAMTLGQPIIFDIFPCQAGGGYFYDITRTWCLGYAPPDVQRLYDDVILVHQAAIAHLRAGELFRDSQELACRLFAQKGHVTILENPGAVEGYVHSLGHGVGLDVHENPFCGISSTPNDRLLPGVVFTIEPGLYYPSKKMGVRIEDTICLNPDGQFEVLAPFPYDLVLPMKTT